MTEKTLYDRWVDTLKCPECGGNNFEIETEEGYTIGTATRQMYLTYLSCKHCGFSLNYGSRSHGVDFGKSIDFINNERERLYEKWQGKVKLSDLEMAEIT
jgi:predicted nucleic-acid-binding Zn-ribbon protein